MAKEKSPRWRTAPTTARAGKTAQTVAPEERRHMIEESAYYRAQQRGFGGGDPVEDWLAAEREINRMLPSPQQQKRELAAYQQLRQAVEKILGDTRETLSAETIRQALDKAVAQLKQLGGYTADTVDKVAASVEKDMANAAQAVGQKLGAFSGKTADLLPQGRVPPRAVARAVLTAGSERSRAAPRPARMRVCSSPPAAARAGRSPARRRAATTQAAARGSRAVSAHQNK
jgi:hypothetical protein